MPGRYHRVDVTRAACVAVALLTWVGAADARIPKPVAQEPAQPRGPRDDLPFSEFPGRTTAAGLRYDLYCPHTSDANPLVVVALDVGATLAHAEPIAHHFARSGLIVVVVEPAPDRASYPSRIGAVLDEVLAARPLEAREPGCTSSGRIGAWGAGRGGAAVAELARTRAAAGKELAAVVTVYAAAAQEVIPDMETPLLVIEGVRGSRQTGEMARSIVIPGGEPCDLRPDDDPCRDRPVGAAPAAAGQDIRDLRAKRTSTLYQRSRQFFRAYVDWDAGARDAVRGWSSEPTERRLLPAESPSRHQIYKLFSLPLLLGGTSEYDGGFVYGVRPELVIARLRKDEWRSGAGPGFGFGAYGELVRWDGESTLGAGVTFVHYLGWFAYAPSVGMVTRRVEDERANAISAGVFLGFRGWSGRLGAADYPVGVRVDGRFAHDGSSERAVMVSACLDLPLVGLFVLGALGGVVTN